jgi:hypothetical protein
MSSTQHKSSEIATAPVMKPAAAHASPSKGASPLRLGILLLVLAACLAALGYDYWLALPRSKAADANLENFVKKRNLMSARKAGPITSADIQKEIGYAPTWVVKKPDYTVEWYCWWGKMPYLTSNRHYITCLYVGENRNFRCHQLNGEPAPEDLPGYFENNTGLEELDAAAVGTESVPPMSPPSMGAGPGPGMGAGMPPGAGGKGKGKGKGKGRGAGGPVGLPGSPGSSPPMLDPAATSPGGADQPAASEATKPTTDAEKSAENKPDSDKPAEDKPAEKPETESNAADKPE